MPPIEYVLSLFRHATSGRGARSTAMKDMNWLSASLLAALVGLSAVGADRWLVVGIAVVLGIVLIRWLVVHRDFAKRDPDLLRSEWFTIERMAMERRATLRGDDEIGMLEVEAADESGPMVSPPALEEDREGGES